MNITLFKIIVASIVLSLSTPALAQEQTTPDCGALLEHEFQLLHDVESSNLCRAHGGKVLLVVNTASRCGFTPQLEGLETLYQTYRERGFAVLGFPSDDFNQELDDEKAIASFCKENYGVSFPMFSKSSVQGDEANPLYRQLTERSGKAPQWNFFKYLIDRDGKVVDVYSSRVAPDDAALIERIESLL